MSRPTHTPRWARGMQKLAPGFYKDAAGALHIDAAEICEAAGVPYNERHHDLIVQKNLEMFEEAARAAGVNPPAVAHVEHKR